MRVLPGRRLFRARQEGADDRCAAGGLHRDHPGPRRPDEPDGLQLGEGLPHADQASAAARRIEDDVGQGPAELLRELDAHRLLALDPVRLLERRDVEPAHALAALRHAPAAVVDEAVDERDVGTRERDLAHVDLGRVGGQKTKRLDAGARGVGRQRCARIAVRRHREPASPE